MREFIYMFVTMLRGLLLRHESMAAECINMANGRASAPRRHNQPFACVHFRTIKRAYSIVKCTIMVLRGGNRAVKKSGSLSQFNCELYEMDTNYWLSGTV